MEAIRHTSRKVAPLDRENVDTDQIIPKQFLKRIERTGYGIVLFFDWRFDADGATRSCVRAERAAVSRRQHSSGRKEFRLWIIA